MQRDIIDQYERGGDLLAGAIAGLTARHLQAFPVPGTWSIQQIVLHLMDADLIIADRMKRVIAEDNPPLIGFDESRFAERLCYADQPADEALRIFDMNRRLFARVLRRLDDSAFQRTGTHNQRGTLTLEQLLQGAIQHLEHHLGFIQRKRAMLGK